MPMDPAMHSNRKAAGSPMPGGSRTGRLQNTVRPLGSAQGLNEVQPPSLRFGLQSRYRGMRVTARLKLPRHCPQELRYAQFFEDFAPRKAELRGQLTYFANSSRIHLPSTHLRPRLPWPEAAPQHRLNRRDKLRRAERSPIGAFGLKTFQRHQPGKRRLQPFTGALSVRRRMGAMPRGQRNGAALNFPARQANSSRRAKPARQ